MHYPRIPREYWRARLRMARAMGLNAITTYVFWNVHEPRPGVYDFSGNNDVAEFIREAQQEGLYVILRPGPYVCAEWEFGGYPAWLLKDHATKVRTTDPKFMEPARRWLMRLGKELAPLQIGNGGPIILMQVENEYGSFGNDHDYMEQIHKALVDAGFTQVAALHGGRPSPGAQRLPARASRRHQLRSRARRRSAASLRDAEEEPPERPLLQQRVLGRLVRSLGRQHAHTNTAAEAANLDWMLEQGYSVSIYMFHGGTSFGWMNGANSHGRRRV